MGERRGTKALEIWCRRITDGYPGVKVDNMTTSWRDGLAFCALIHHFRPDLIDFSSLKKEDVYHNNELAFRTAESYLGIPALLDAEDMAQYAVPDRLSILTYLSQYYQHFASTSGSSPSRIMTKRSSSSKECDNLPVSPSSTSPPTKMSAGGLGRREPCISCGQPVFLAQRLLVDRRLYHRTCFRCARCGAQLTLASCYETEVDGQYCCETCPDEETNSTDKNFERIYNENINIDDSDLKEIKTLPVFRKTLSDEEKSDNLAKLPQSTEITTKIPTTTPAIHSTAFTGFMSSQLKEMDSDNDDVLPELPKSLPPSKSTEPSDYSIFNNVTNDIYTQNENLTDEFLDSFKYQNQDEIKSQGGNEILESKDILVSGISDNIESSHSVKKTDIIDSKNSVLIDSVNVSNAMAKTSESMSMEQIDVKNSSDSEENVNIKNIDTSQHETASVLKDDVESNICISDPNKKDVIKNETLLKDFEKSQSNIISAKNESLIKMRMKIFEKTDPEFTKKSSTQAVSRKSYEYNNEMNVELTNNKVNNIPSNNVTDISKSETSDILSSHLDDSSTIVNKNSQNESHDNNDVPYNKSVPCDKTMSQLNDNHDNINIAKDSIEFLVTKNELVKVDIEDDELKHNDNDKDVETSINLDIIETENEKVIHELNVTTSDKNEIIVSKENQITSDTEEDDKNNMDVLENSKVLTADENTEINNKKIENHSNITIVVDEVESSHQNNKEEEKESSKKLSTQNTEVEELDKDNKNYPIHLNPFSDDEDSDSDQKLPTDVAKQESLNPFDDSDDEGLGSEIQNTQTESNSRRKSADKPPRPPLPAVIANAIKSQLSNPDLKKVTSTSFNPFSSDEDENSDEEKLSSCKPIPAPRHRIEEEPSSILSTQSFYGSSSSLTSTVSRRKKAPAPKPPNALVVPHVTPRQISLNEHGEVVTSQLSSPSSSLSHISPQISPRLRKRRPAPRPPNVGPQPTATSTFVESSLNTSFNTSDQTLDNSSDFFTSISELDDKSIISYSKKVISAADFDNDPDISANPKDDINVLKENTKNIENEEISARPASIYLDKSSSGQWKRRKGPAPAVPLLQKRIAGPPIPPAQIRKELQLLEAQQRGLERQGVRLEEIIRERCESGETIAVTAEPDPETDELVLQLFELVNEKNELFRRQAELMYIRRQQRLEEEHADLEHQIRILMSRPEANKTDSDKAREEQLIQRLLEVVERRDEVITSLEMDRLREKEEDKSIRERMASHRAKRDENSSLSSMDIQETIPKKDKKKEKKRWLKKEKSKVSDDNKIGVDESEKMTLKKEKKHKKWF